jgi:hypothetical protein
MINHTEKVLNTAFQSGVIRPEAQHAFISSSPSKAIPIKGWMKQTNSELQLMESKALAEERDYCMYKRIVEGMSRQNSNSLNASWTSDDSLANIIRTRHTPVVLMDGFKDIIECEYAFPSDRLQHTRSYQDHHPNSSPQENLVINDDDREEEDAEIFELDM